MYSGSAGVESETTGSEVGGMPAATSPWESGPSPRPVFSLPPLPPREDITHLGSSPRGIGGVGVGWEEWWERPFLTAPLLAPELTPAPLPRPVVGRVRWRHC